MADDVLVTVNGTPYFGWKSVSVQKSFEKATGNCTLKTSPSPGETLPIYVGDKVLISLVGTPIITGHAHGVRGNHTEGEHGLSYTIRDKTQDFIDSTVGPKMTFKAPIKLDQALIKGLDHMGLGAIKVVKEVDTPEFKQGEVPSAEIGETGFNFFENWARKRQVFLNSNGDGDIVITRNLDKSNGAILYKGPEDSANNVLEAEYEADDFDQANSYAVASQKSTNDKEFWESRPKGEPIAQADKLSTQYGFASDSSVRPERRFHFRGVKGIQGRTPDETATWQANVNRAKGITYTATVQGFTHSGGGLWLPGELVRVYDYHFELDCTMFIKSVDYDKTESGTTSRITCGPKDSYKPEAEAPKGDQRAGKQGAAIRTSGHFKNLTLKEVTG